MAEAAPAGQPDSQPCTSLPLSITVMRHGRRQDTHDSQWILTARHPWDTPLSPNAGDEIVKVAQLLQSKGKTFDVVYTSPFLRCLQTVQGLLCALGIEDVPVFVHRGLSEVHSPHLIFKCPRPSLASKLRKWAWRTGYKRRTHAERSRCGAKWEVLESEWPPMIEREQAAGERFFSTIQQLALAHPGKHVLFVSHGKAVQVARECVAPERHVQQVGFVGFTACRPRPGTTARGWLAFQPDPDLPTYSVEFADHRLRPPL